MPVTRPTISKGSRGDAVKLMQEKLVELGYDLSPYGADGSFGNKTLSALKAFQKDHGLTADGICGPKTWAALEDSKPGKKYTVKITGLSEYQMEALRQLYPGAEVAEEGSVE